jgi:NADH dehydrogenase/NADH:ubiquinone oxidoreductase subunit G
MDKINVTLNGQPVSGEKGITILQLAKENEIDIPTL